MNIVLDYIGDPDGWFDALVIAGAFLALAGAIGIISVAAWLWQFRRPLEIEASNEKTDESGSHAGSDTEEV